MSNNNNLDDLRSHLQTAIDVELSTIPIYLYTYYSINRQPSSNTVTDKIATFANKAGGILMGVAVEEMLHLSLVSNILKSLGGEPKIYGRSPKKYPTNLEHHKSGFSIGLTKFTKDQLKKFMEIEKPAPAKEEPEGDDWETLGQFYEYVSKLIRKTKDSDYGNKRYQLVEGKGYYASSNVDTIYPKDGFYMLNVKENPNDPSAKGANQAIYPNSDDSGGLRQITCRKDALDAITEISEQGEGYRKSRNHKYDDKNDMEESHWYKYNDLHKEFIKMKLTPEQLGNFIHNFPDSPKTSDYPANIQPVVDLCNAVYSYLLWMTEKSFELQGSAQAGMFYIGMHKGMIFILDKLIGPMRYLTYVENGITYNVGPSFENYPFRSIERAKADLVALSLKVQASGILDISTVIPRIMDLPDVYVVNNVVSFA